MMAHAYKMTWIWAGAASMPLYRHRSRRLSYVLLLSPRNPGMSACCLFIRHRPDKQYGLSAVHMLQSPC